MRSYSKQLWQWCGTPAGRKFVALLALALLVRLALAPFFGVYHDLQDYVNWGLLFDQHPLGFYALSSGWSPFEAPNYPPLMIYLCGALTGAYFGAARVLGLHASSLVAAAPPLMVWMKLPAILGDLGTVSVLYLLARRAFSERGALFISASYAFSPAILFDSAFWGQTDGIPVLFLLLALLCSLRFSAIRAGVLFGLALVLKLQVIIFAPLILLYLWRWAGWKQALQAAGSMAVVALVMCSPYLLPPSPGLLALYQNLQKWANISPASDHAFNLWFLLGASRSPSEPLVAFFSPTSLGLTLFVAILLLVLFGIWKARSAQMLFLGAALVSVAFFGVMTLQHERYLYPAVALALAAALYAQRGWSFYVVASGTLFLNMLLIVMTTLPDQFGLSRAAADRWSGAVIGAALALALVNIWLLGRMIVSYLGRLRHLSAAPASSAAVAAAYAPVLKGEVTEN